MILKRTLAALIPAHNESGVIGATIESLLSVVPRDNIYVVSDVSIDDTAAIARKYGVEVLDLHLNVGKATAMNRAIEFFHLTDRYEFVLPMDADTKITGQFVENILAVFAGDGRKEIACVVGKVIGNGHRWITTFRLWEYEISQTIHKNAQSAENAIIVCPGCATIFRAEVFAKLKVPTGTLTEDMDMTFQIHRRKLGKIVFTDKAVVVTQDPETLRDFVKQIDRWYSGFWQCVTQNNIPWGGQVLDLEVGMLAIEGLFNGVLMAALIIIIPFTVRSHPYVLITPFLMDLLFFPVPHWQNFFQPVFIILKRTDRIALIPPGNPGGNI